MWFSILVIGKYEMFGKGRILGKCLSFVEFGRFENFRRFSKYRSFRIF